MACYLDVSNSRSAHGTDVHGMLLAASGLRRTP